MSSYEDDTPFEVPEYLKGLTHEQLQERIKKLYSEHEKKPPIQVKHTNT
jgi:hypothetical protein